MWQNICIFIFLDSTNIDDRREKYIYMQGRSYIEAEEAVASSVIPQIIKFLFLF